ncbi:MAG: autotransporter outer membrane beta-barrel domain-containing protein, partial [Brucellaceae bacterium]|nr:autotransporter outer membrane beta-barrel domain-containing protein [Brucellaceae bacterium]
LDGLLYENEAGKFIGGITVQYTHGQAHISSPHNSDLGRGKINTDGYGFGGTLTWYGDNGLYLDNQAQLNWYRSDLEYKGGHASLKNGKSNGFGYALSGEIGKRFAFDEQWALTPQAQLRYSNARFNSFTDIFGAEVSRERADSLEGRLGLSLDYQNIRKNEQGSMNRSSVYGIANLYNEFLDGTRVDVASVKFTNKSERLWGGIGLGGSYNWNDDQYALYGEGSVNTSLQHFGDSYAYKGSIGFRVKW